MAKRSVLRRLTECSASQQEAVARAIGFDIAALPPSEDHEARAQELVVWATGPEGPGLLGLEAALPWADESDMARQFGVGVGSNGATPVQATPVADTDEPARHLADALRVAEQAGPRLNTGAQEGDNGHQAVRPSVVEEPILSVTPMSDFPSETGHTPPPQLPTPVVAEVVSASSEPEPVVEKSSGETAPAASDPPAPQEPKRPSVFGGRPISMADRPDFRDRPERPAASAGGKQPANAATSSGPARPQRPAVPTVDRPNDNPHAAAPGGQTAAVSSAGQEPEDDAGDPSRGGRRWWRRLLRGRHAR